MLKQKGRSVMMRRLLFLFSLLSMSTALQATFLIEASPIQLAFNVPHSFGKTHFIVGYSHDVKNEEKNDYSLVPITNQALFSPDDNLQKKLLNLIDQEKYGIKIAVYWFTDGEIAKALIKAKDRGIIIEIITDPTCLHDTFSKIELLRSNGIMVYVYNPTYYKTVMFNKMHSKFALFKQNRDNKTFVWNGSFNFTRSADRNNQESVVVTDDPSIFEQFENQFNRLKERSDVLSSDTSHERRSSKGNWFKRAPENTNKVIEYERTSNMQKNK